jgi:membrane associated rhomboid family serine protease
MVKDCKTYRVGADFFGGLLKDAIEVAIAAHVDPTIGGDVAVVILERDKPLRWFNRPAVCGG